MQENVTHKPFWKWWVLIGTCLAGMMVALDFTIVNTSLNDIQENLQSTMQQLQWFIAGFGLTFCSFLATMGRLADMLGRRKILYIGMIVFGIASFGAGVAQTSWQLIVFRLLQGLGGSVVFPAGMAATVDAFPKAEEGRALGVYASIIGIGLAFGPLLGGMITAVASWRWIFYINIPVIIASFMICIATVRESRLGEALKIDWWGMLFITLFIASLIYVVTEGPDIGWTSLESIALFATSLVSFVLLILIEKRTAAPLLPLKLFENRGFLLGCIFYVAGVSVAWVLTFFIPLYLHNVLGYGPAGTGLMMLPMTALTAIIPSVAGYSFDKRGIKFACIYLIFLPMIFSYLLMIGFDETTTLWLLIPAYILFGIGWGAANGIGMPTALSQLANTSNAGVVSGAAITILNMTGVILLVICGTLFRYVQADKIFSLLKLANIKLTGNDNSLILTLLAQPEKAKPILAQFSQATSHKIAIFYQQSFTHGYVAVVVALLALTLILFIWTLRLLRT